VSFTSRLSRSRSTPATQSQPAAAPPASPDETKRKAASRKPSEPDLDRCRDPLRSVLTRPLGLAGWAHLEPVVLASLASREPMLLIGPHGTAKSFLLERLAEALALEFRAYNASLISYDDLVGIPLPDETGQGLKYISTPTSIWNAEVVFVDEINRTRPDLQNKLFPIVHERRVQGVRLEKLRHRWAAMNPPPLDDEPEDETYIGAEPLDPALADRFPFLVVVPDWDDLTEQEQKTVLLDQFRGRHEFPVALPELVRRAELEFGRLLRQVPERLCEYFRLVERSTKDLGRLSPRRMTMLLRSALAIHAARRVLESCSGERVDIPPVDLETSCWHAVLHGLPVLARRAKVDRAKLLAAHRHAWSTSGLAEGDPWREILAAADPVEGMLRALTWHDPLPDERIANCVLDGVASVQHEARRTAVAFAAYLSVRRSPGVHALVLETLATDVRRVLEPQHRDLSVSPGSGLDWVREVGCIVEELTRAGSESTRVRDAHVRNLLEALLPDGYSGVTPREVFDLFLELWKRLDLDRCITAVEP